MFLKSLLINNTNGDEKMILGIPSGAITQCGSTTNYVYWNAKTLSSDVIAIKCGARPNERGAGLKFTLPDGKIIETGELKTDLECLSIFLPKGTKIEAIINGSDRVYATCYHGTFVEVDSSTYLGG